jgi:branched-chain amino acid transport system ATP-binding protein
LERRSSLLKVEDLSFSYDLLQVLWSIDLHVRAGEFVSLIGANGAGKSTLLKCVAGLYNAYQGRVFFDGKDLNRIAAPEITRMGLSLVPEGRLLFPSLSTLENLQLGAYRRYGGPDEEKIPEDLAYVFELFPILKERRDQKAHSLSGGEAQVLAVGRGLMARPKLLLLDEPSVGLSPLWTTFLFQRIVELREKGITIVMSEQNAAAALRMADRAYVLERGRVVLKGKGADLLINEEVKRAYLG